mmetsp:Transcript_35743/g.91914  ORF Transcript_35743/g.91914 Transcript_35743/m.91914 type:complete len:91 (-) Transcript_35743:266-538(-)
MHPPATQKGIAAFEGGFHGITQASSLVGSIRGLSTTAPVGRFISKGSTTLPVSATELLAKQDNHEQLLQMLVQSLSCRGSSLLKEIVGPF